MHGFAGSFFKLSGARSPYNLHKHFQSKRRSMQAWLASCAKN